jgi:hypothetical protein
MRRVRTSHAGRGTCSSSKLLEVITHQIACDTARKAAQTLRAVAFAGSRRQIRQLTLVSYLRLYPKFERNPNLLVLTSP